MAAIPPIHMFCPMTLSLSHGGGAYFSNPSSAAGLWLIEYRSDPILGIALNYPSPASTHKIPCSWEYYSWKPNTSRQYDYTETTVEKPWRMTEPCGEAKEHRGTSNAGEEAIMEVDPPGPVSAMWKQWPRWVLPKWVTHKIISKIKWLV